MDERVRKRLEKLKKDAGAGGYRLNPDEKFVEELVEGLLANNDRYGIESCPCRLMTGKPEDNLDIVCPCVYRDDDLADHGACFCALYVTDDANEQKQVPERRPPESERAKKAKADGAVPSTLAYPVYRCGVCGYLCANNNPPRVCPVCKAGKERFERFI
jgi:ferredoxin-thioredoxin reductase catalytic chain